MESEIIKFIKSYPKSHYSVSITVKLWTKLSVVELKYLTNFLSARRLNGQRHDFKSKFYFLSLMYKMVCLRILNDIPKFDYNRSQVIRDIQRFCFQTKLKSYNLFVYK